MTEARQDMMMKNLLARTPLRVKLVALLLALVTLALAVIIPTSTLMFRRYLVDRIDQDISNFSQQVIDISTQMRTSDGIIIVFPPDTRLDVIDPQGNIGVPGPTGRLEGLAPSAYHQLGPLPHSMRDAISNSGVAYTAAGQGATAGQWRVLVTPLKDGSFLAVAQKMSSVDKAVGKLTSIELISGLAVLAVLIVVAIAIVRASLRPLVTIEQTAEAIAAGDLARRVPQFEPEPGEPRTEVGRLGRALNIMLRQIESAFIARALSESRARHSEVRMRQFIADASHELRTPLTTIRGFSELYRQGAVRNPEQVADLFRRIEGEAQRMGLLVEDLLLLARLDRQRPLMLVPLDLRVIASEAVDAARAMAPHREISLDLADGPGPVMVRADEARMRQVIGNLMTNALVHTPGSTPVWLRLRRIDDHVVIEVEDRGPGLTPEQAERVFERFYRIDAARTRRGAGDGDGRGTGLGLAIVSALVTAHGGRVSVSSEVGRGSIFRVVLPAMRSDDVGSDADDVDRAPGDAGGAPDGLTNARDGDGPAGGAAPGDGGAATGTGGGTTARGVLVGPVLNPAAPRG